MAVKRYDGSAWQTVAGLGAQGPAATSSSIATWVKTASGGETSVSGNDDNSQPLSYTVGQELVFINGALQKRGFDYTATTGNSITGLTALAANDVVTVWTVNAFSVANTYTQAQVDAAFVNNTNFYAAGKNILLNSDFNIWQRGTSFTTISNVIQYCADRWFGFVGAVVTQAQAIQSTDVPTGFTYSVKFGRPNGETDNNFQYLCQILETAASKSYAGKTVTLSFYAKKGANYTSASDAIVVKFSSGTGTDQSAATFSSGPATGFTGNTLVIDSTATLTTSWQRFSFTGTIGSTATQLGLAIGYDPVGTAGADDNFYITGVQLELGSVATAFETATGNPASELAACQRYYIRTTSTADYGRYGTGIYGSSTLGYPVVNLPVTMRIAPSSVDYSTLALWDGGAFQAATNLTIHKANPQYVGLEVTVASGGTQYRPCILASNNSTTAYLGFSAEL